MLGVMAVLLVVSQYRRPPPHSQALESWQASSATSHEADITDSESMCSSTDFKHVLVCAVHGPSSTTLYRSRQSAGTSQQVLGRPVGPAYLVLNSTIAGLSLWADRHRGSGGALGVSPACVDDQLALVVPARPAAGRRPTQVWSPCISAVVGSVRVLPVCGRGGLDLSSKEARPPLLLQAPTPQAIASRSVLTRGLASPAQKSSICCPISGGFGFSVLQISDASRVFPTAANTGTSPQICPPSPHLFCN